MVIKDIIYFLFENNFYFEFYILERNLPIASDIAIVMYTSGSTGIPKGVNLTHTNLISTLKAFTDAINIDYKKDVFMGYLPLAHVFELLGGNLNIN